MRPKKAKELIPSVCGATCQSPQVVTDVINFYWQEVRKNLSALSATRIHLTNLGDFTIKHWKLAGKITQLEKFEENSRARGMQQMTARFKTAESIYEMRLMQEMIDVENQRKLFIKLHNQATKDADQKNISAAVGKQRRDPGRDTEQRI